MKSPFVSRDTHEAVLTQLADARALVVRMGENHRRALELAEGHTVRVLQNHEAEIERCEKRFADLMASYRMLKLQGATEVAPPPAREIKPVDAVEAAIREECRDKPAEVARQMRESAAQARAGKINDEEIIKNIRRGSRPAEEMAS